MRLMSYRYRLSVVAGIILGLIFITAGLGKLLYQLETFKVFYTPPVTLLPPALTNSIFIWLPSIELLLGLLLILGIAPKLTATCSSVLIAAFIANNSWLLSQGLGYKSCPECFGIWESIFMGELSTIGALYLDVGMLALAFIIVFCYPGNLLTTQPWFLGKR